MISKLHWTPLSALVGILVLGVSFLGAQSASTPPSKTSEQAFKNIQILKGIPADQLIPSMQFISASLGVECEYCHVAGALDKDDKKPKQTARKMMEMMFAINNGHFDGHRQVTCYSCHHGNAHPVAVPIIPAAASTTALADPLQVPEKPADGKGLPAEGSTTNDKAAVDAILEKYVAALGGAAAIQKVSSRVEQGSADLGGRTFPIEIFVQSPDKRVSVMHLPNGDSITAFNGTEGWMSTPGRPTQWMGEAESDAYRFDADLHVAVRMKEVFSDFSLLPPQNIDGREAVVVRGIRSGETPVELYFDRQSGLLVRLVRYADTPLGSNPTRIDYADYKEMGGVKTPYRWTIARPSGQFTIQVEQGQQNVPIPAEKFASPLPAPASP